MYCGERGLVRSQWRGRKIFSERESFHFCGDGTAAVFLDLEAPVAHGLLTAHRPASIEGCLSFCILHLSMDEVPDFPSSHPASLGARRRRVRHARR